MQTEATVAAPEFAGKKDQQALARELLGIFQARGRFFSDSAPIRLTLAQLAEFKQAHDPKAADWVKRIDAALTVNPAIFAREESNGEVVFTTTRSGSAGGPAVAHHDQPMLARRFATPEPKRAIPVTRRSPIRHSPSFLGFDQSPTDEPIQWQEVAPRTPEQAAIAAGAQLTADEISSYDEVEVQHAVAAVVAESDVDVASATDDMIADAIRTSLSREISVARWGDIWMGEDRVQRYSRGDLRRIEEFLRDQDGIATDEEIVQDILGIRPNADEYAGARFALNYRLSRETREFEYIGTDTEGLWATANLPAIGTTRRKPAEIGQDYRFLLEYNTQEPGIEEGLVEHVLSFYEYTYGVLPLDANLSTIMPKPGFAEQRAARLTFESPQTTETVVAELRFSTGNRGGFISGLEQFFADNLVPGAVLTIEKTDRSNHFLLEYFRISANDRKLLHLDERKGKYAFRSTTYYCATQDEFVIEEGRFPKLADAKPLDDRARRRPEQVIAATFERVGDNVGSEHDPRYVASFGDLLAAANIERPVSAEMLRDLLTNGAHPEFGADDTGDDVFYYQPIV